MTDVCLVLMPYAGIERPSLALGLLKASLKESSISSKVLYPNLWFAEDIGIYKYKAIADGLAGGFVGEWTFSGAAFPDFQPDRSEYFQVINRNKSDLIRDLWEVRNRAISFIDRVAQSILKLHPRIVSCSSTFHQHCASLAVLRRIRELEPEIITVIGGANCEGPMGLATLRAFPWVDFVCSGEGDNLFVKLCSQLLDKGRDLASTDLPYGVMSSTERHRSLASKQVPRASVQDLDRIPIPDFDDYFQTLHRCQISRYITPALLIETSRGCWWGQKQQCTFCGLNGEGMTYRSKSPPRVIKEFAELSQRYNVTKFFVVDNILDLKHVNTVLPMFAALEKPYSIFYETKANLKRQQVQQLAKAGVRWIQPGIESMHDELLRLMRKGNTALINVQLLKWAQEFGIQVAWNFLAGLPGELGQWYAEQIKWLPLIVHLQPPTGVTKIRFDRFSPYHERPENYGLKLVPNRAYSYIYPLAPEIMQELAYYFEEVGDREEAVKLKEEQTKSFPRELPEHQTLKQMVAQWQKLYSSREPPILRIVEDDGDRLRIVDTRPGAIQKEHYLEGLAYKVYVACDRALTPKELVNVMGTQPQQGLNQPWSELKPVVEQLQESKILLSLNSRLLSLAVREPVVPLPRLEEQPGGYVDVRGYLRDNRKPFWELLRDRVNS